MREKRCHFAGIVFSTPERFNFDCPCKMGKRFRRLISHGEALLEGFPAGRQGIEENIDLQIVWNWHTKGRDTVVKFSVSEHIFTGRFVRLIFELDEFGEHQLLNSTVGVGELIHDVSPNLRPLNCFRI